MLPYYQCLGQYSPFNLIFSLHFRGASLHFNQQYYLNASIEFGDLDHDYVHGFENRIEYVTGQLS